jgi:hypothetical protein
MAPSGEATKGEAAEAKAWTDRYEAVRQQALERSGHDKGLALLLRCGLATWLRTWSVDAGSPADGQGARQQPKAADAPEAAGDLAREITRVLVNMFLDHKETEP